MYTGPNRTHRKSTGSSRNLSFSNIPWRKVGRYFPLFGGDYYKGFHSFVLLGKLTKSEFGKSVHWTGQRVHFDRNTATKALKVVPRYLESFKDSDSYIIMLPIIPLH